MSSYAGISVRRMVDGTIYSVRLRHGSDEIEVAPESYLSGGGRPPLHHLAERNRRELPWTPPMGYKRPQEFSWRDGIEVLALLALRFFVLLAFGCGALWGVVGLFKWMWEHS